VLTGFDDKLKPDKKLKSTKKTKVKSPLTGNGESTLKGNKVGVIDTIVECLTKASANKPASKDQILERLVKKFPERDPMSMKKTLTGQLSYHLKHNGKIKKLMKSSGGYWA